MIAFVRQVYKLLFVHIIEGGPFSFVDDVFPRGVPIETKALGVPNFNIYDAKQLDILQQPDFHLNRMKLFYKFANSMINFTVVC
jgi:hypothetical protein